MRFTRRRTLGKTFRVLGHRGHPEVTLLQRAAVRVHSRTDRHRLLTIERVHHTVSRVHSQRFARQRRGQLRATRQVIKRVRTGRFAFRVRLNFLVPLLRVKRVRRNVTRTHVIFTNVFRVKRRVGLTFNLLTFRASRQVGHDLVGHGRNAAIQVSQVGHANLGRQFGRSAVRHLRQRAPSRVERVRVLTVVILAFLSGHVGHDLTGIAGNTGARARRVTSDKVLMRQLIRIEERRLSTRTADLTRVRHNLIFIHAHALRRHNRRFRQVVHFRVYDPV